MDLGLKGRVVLVTGASRGIGAATAKVLAEEGAKLVLLARDGDALRQLAATLGGHNVDVAVCIADLTEADAAQRGVQAAIDAYGRLDAVVACAGASAGGEPADLAEAAWRTSFELKFFATLRLLQAALQPMRAQQQGVFLVVGGNIGRQPNPMMLPGSAVNAALHAVSKGFADRYARDGVRLHVLNPGPTRTERLQRYIQMIAERDGRSLEDVARSLVADAPQQRIAEPQEMGALAAWMISDRFACATGNQVTADGGWVRSPA